MELDTRKLFVGGIPRGTNEDLLKKYFSKYGIVEESLILVNRHTGQGRGFAFVTFAHKAMADKALQDQQHIILGKKVDVKHAKPKTNQDMQANNGNGNNQFNTKKIFVGGLPPEITEDEFKNYFKSFGTITDAVVIYDKETRRPRGFGFITFDSEKAVDNVSKQTFHKLNQKMVEVKRAVPKDRNTDKQFNYYNSYNRNSGFGTWLPSSYNGIYPPYALWYDGNHPYHYYGWDSYVFGPAPYGCLEFPYVVPSSQGLMPYGSPMFYTPCTGDQDYVNDWAGRTINNNGGDGNLGGNGFVSSQGQMPHGSPVFYPPYSGDQDYLNDWTGSDMNKNGGDGNHGRTTMKSTLNGNLDENNGSCDVKVRDIIISPQTDDSSSKSNGNNDSGNVEALATTEVPTTSNSPQIDNSSSLESNGQEQETDGESNPSNSWCTLTIRNEACPWDLTSNKIQ